MRSNLSPTSLCLLTGTLVLAALLLHFFPGGGVPAGLLLGGSVSSWLRRRRGQDAQRLTEKMAALTGEMEAQGEAMRTQRQELEDSAQTLAQTNILLAQASGRFQELFQGLPVACVCYDRQGNIMEWNRAFERLYARADLFGQSIWQTVYCREEAPQMAEAVTAALGGETREGVEWTHARPDGVSVRLHCSIFPLRGADGEITGGISADVDITAQHEAEEALRASEERLHALYNTTSQQDLSFEAKVDALLRMGSQHFGMEIGVLARVLGEDYEVMQSLSPDNCLASGTMFPVCNTYCREALSLANVVSFECAGETERRDSDVYRQSGLEAYIGTPVRVAGEVWGMLCFTDSRPYSRPFASGDREMIRLMAQWIGGEMARRQAEDAVKESEARFRSAIGAMSEGLIVMDADGIIRLCNESAENVLGLTRGEVQKWQPLNPDYIARREDGSPFPQGSYPLVISLRSGLPQRGVVMGLPRPDGGLLWVSVNSSPLRRPGEETPWAVVATFSDITERRRDEDKIAAQMAQIKEYTGVLEFQKTQLEEVNRQLEELAMRDGLTGLGNRRAFSQRMSLEVGRAARYGTPLSLIIFDVDSFKEYNDTYGHLAGDEVLTKLALVLDQQGRETDFFARYGGEEFAVLLPHTDSLGAMIVAERLREAVAEAAWPGRPVTASFGTATLLPAMLDEMDLIADADRALYAAKAAGRNCAIHAQSLLSSETAEAVETGSAESASQN